MGSPHNATKGLEVVRLQALCFGWCQVKFVVDCMLGSLAKWLRLLGYDTLYANRASDRELVRVARAEGRILLTRDLALSRSRNVSAVFVESQQLPEQLRQTITVLGLSPTESLSRCPVCNGELQAVPVEVVADRVPPYVAQTQTQFHVCRTCSKVYWPGTHWQAMRSRLSGMIRADE